MNPEQREILERELRKDISEKVTVEELPCSVLEVSKRLGIPYNQPVRKMLYPLVRDAEINHLKGLSDDELVEWINNTSQKTTPKRLSIPCPRECP